MYGVDVFDDDNYDGFDDIISIIISTRCDEINFIEHSGICIKGLWEICALIYTAIKFSYCY